MEIKNNQIIIGNYQGVNFHYIFNQNDGFLINATDIANHFNIDLSIYLEQESTKYYIANLLLPKEPSLKIRKLEDVLLIERGIYYFHKFLIFDLCKSHNDFYWWIDNLFYDLMIKHQKPLI